MGTSLDGETRQFTRVYVIYDVDITGSEHDIERMSPAVHMPAGYGDDPGNEQYGLPMRRRMEAVAAKFTQTESDAEYGYDYLADGDGTRNRDGNPDRDRFLCAVDRPDGYEGDGYQGRHRKWTAELTRQEWELFAHAYIIDLNERGFPVDYEDTLGAITEYGHLDAVAVDNSEGWNCSSFDGVIASQFYVSFGGDDSTE